MSKRAEVDRLRAENEELKRLLRDVTAGPPQYCMARDLATVQRVCEADIGEGAVIETTDTRERYHLHGGTWAKSGIDGYGQPLHCIPWQGAGGGRRSWTRSRRSAPTS